MLQDGKVHVYDLYLNKYKPVCVQQIVPRKRGRLNHLAFNPTHPVIIVGDSEGTVHSLKVEWTKYFQIKYSKNIFEKQQ